MTIYQDFRLDWRANNRTAIKVQLLGHTDNKRQRSISGS